MNRKLMVTGGLLAGTAVLTGRQVMRRQRQRPARYQGRDRWHSITINRDPEHLSPMPPPLDRLPIPVHVRIQPAPAGRGTEVAARLAEPPPHGIEKVLVKTHDRDRVRLLRRALREARAIAEVGEVLLPDSPPTTEPTLTGAPLAYATRHGREREEGRL